MLRNVLRMRRSRSAAGFAKGVEIMSDCIFCKIAGGEIPTDFVYQDEDVVVFRDVAPQAPTHLLVIPRCHVASSAEVKDSA